MKTMAFLSRHALVIFFILAYLISWGGIILIIGPEGFRIFQGAGVLKEGFAAEKMLPMWLVMLAGPSVSCLLLTGLISGRKAFRGLLASMTRVRVPFKWYAAALLIVPAVLAAVLYSLTLFSPNYTPGLMVVFGILAGFFGGSVEELGWTGFALPRLQVKYTPLVAGVILAVIHLFWHLLADYWGGISFYQGYYLFHFLLWLISFIPYRLLSVWIFNRTQSLFLAQLTHASFTGSQLLFSPPKATVVEAIVWYTLFAVALWAVVAVIIFKDKKAFLQKVAA